MWLTREWLLDSKSAKVSVVPAAPLSALQSRAGGDNRLSNGKSYSQGTIGG